MQAARNAANAAKAAKPVQAVSKASAPSKKQDTSTYVLKNTSNEVKYVGITSRNPALRAAEHAATPEKAGLRMEVVGSGLTRTQARVWEQSQINRLGMQKNGGDLLNKINSIAPNKWGLFGL